MDTTVVPTSTYTRSVSDAPPPLGVATTVRWEGLALALSGALFAAKALLDWKDR
jgi:hypothetical protein